MISLKDIAEECGVSISTVSKVLNNQKDVGAETQKRVKRAAKEMGYFPNSAARALKTRRSYNLGILFKDEGGSGLTHEYFSGVLDGIMMQAGILGYDITFINNHQHKRRMSYYEHCCYRNFDGVVVACEDFRNPEVTELLSNNQIPVLTIDYLHQNCSTVSSDNVKGMADLVSHIYENGHRKIAYVHGQTTSYVTRDRLASFHLTMRKLGMDIPEGYIQEAAYSETKDTARHTEALLQLRERPTCIIYPDDMALIGGWNVIHQAGLRIPEDISVAGYDGSKMSQLISPKLTTVQQDTAVIGKTAASILIDRIEKPKTSLIERVVIPGNLLPGDSVGRISD
jgi:LacI family transcriptional regulator